VKWICCQVGAREHYAVPRALFRLGTLEYLLTDGWVPPGSFLTKLCSRESRLHERFHTELSDAPVKAFTSSFLLFEMAARARRLGMWPSILARNRWFQRRVVSFLRSQPSTLNSQLVLLSYSYAALEPLRYAKAHGWKTVLIQIDPGPEEEKMVAKEAERVPELAGAWQPAPQEYWNSWREECKLADRIVINSEWSREGLVRGGVAAEKLTVIPLAYETPEDINQKLHRSYPVDFLLLTFHFLLLSGTPAEQLTFSRPELLREPSLHGTIRS